MYIFTSEGSYYSDSDSRKSYESLNYYLLFGHNQDGVNIQKMSAAGTTSAVRTGNNWILYDIVSRIA